MGIDKGIRPAAFNKFVELNELRLAGVYGAIKGVFAEDRTPNKTFRAAVNGWVMEQFGCTISSAAGQYNYALQRVTRETPEKVQGLHRPEDKKGGRKKKEVAAAVVAEQEAAQEIATQVVWTVETAPAAELTIQEVVAPEPVREFVDAEFQEQDEYKVYKKRCNSLVAEGLTFEQARNLVTRAQHAKKAALYWV